jgi:hypothetical protein
LLIDNNVRLSPDVARNDGHVFGGGTGERE